MTHPNLPGTDDTVLEASLLGRWRWRTFIIVLAAALAVYTGWWFWLAAEVRTQLDGWIASMRADGRDAVYGTLSVSGFPGVLAIHLERLDAADPAGGWRIQVPEVNGALSPWDISALSGSFQGPLMVIVEKGAAPGRYAVRAARNSYTAGLVGGGSLDLDLGDVVLRRDLTDEEISLKTLSANLRRGSAPVFAQLHLDARDVRLPPSLHSAFGGGVAVLRLTAEATGAVPPAGLTPESLRAWSNNGGAVDIRALDIEHGVLGLNGEGTLALDGEMQPIGAFTARISGFNAAVDALVDAGVARPEDAALAKIVLGVLATSPPGGGAKVVSLPLTLQDRKLSAGPVPLIRLKPIEWD